jgi:hypothetical protein
MRVLSMGLVLSTLVGVAACGNSTAASDTKLAEDLRWLDSLSVAPPAAAPQGYVSPLELGQDGAPEVQPEPVPAVTRASAPAPQRSASASRSRSSGSRSGSVASAPAPQPRRVTVKNTKRDAAIGAGAGAVIGAVAGGKHHRVKGAVIGGAVGGVVGAVIGNNVDKSTRIEY